MMTDFTASLMAELLKLRHTRMTWVSFIAFGLGPLMGGLFMIILSDPELAANAPGLQMKAAELTVDWNSYFGVLSQVMGVGGILLFGFVSSWIFGREYTDHTAKDMLALPMSRWTVVTAKYTCYIIWCVFLALSNLLLTLLIGLTLRLPDFSMIVFGSNMHIYMVTTLLTIIISTPVALFALWGRGYLSPLAFVALILVLSQIIAAAGYGMYFPWAVPGMFSGTGGAANMQLSTVSYLILLVVGAMGFAGTGLYWRFTDHAK